MSEDTKQCTSCRTTKHISKFMKVNKELKSCLECRQYQIDNRETIQSKQDKEHIKQKTKAYYEKHKQKYSESGKQFRMENPNYYKVYQSKLVC